MKTFKTTSFTGFFALVILLGCSSSADIVDMMMEKDPEVLSILACKHDSIRTDTLYFDLGGDIIKLPTMFSPNGDDINDTFYPRFENSEITISQYAVYTPLDVNSRIMYSINKLIYPENGEVERAWDGESRYTDELIMKDYEGVFKFSFFATNPEFETIQCTGWACANRS